jgi:hypothetical protein
LAEREQAKRNQAFIIAKCIGRDLKRGAVRLAACRLRQSGLTAYDWLKYLRRQRRTLLSGTPLSPDGEFVDPEWLRTERRAAHETVTR